MSEKPMSGRLSPAPRPPAPAKADGANARPGAAAMASASRSIDSRIDAAAACRASACRSCRRRPCRPRPAAPCAEPSLTMMPFSNRRRAATTCTIGTARPSAQGQVMISTAMAMLMARCQSPVAAIQPRKVRKAVGVDDRRIERGGAVGDAAVAGAAAFGRFHQAHHLGEEGALPRARSPRPSAAPVRLSVPACTADARRDAAAARFRR